MLRPGDPIWIRVLPEHRERRVRVLRPIGATALSDGLGDEALHEQSTRETFADYTVWAIDDVRR